MSSLKKFNLQPEMFTAAVVASAGLAGLVFWRSLEKVRTKQSKWQLIEDLQQREANFRFDLRRKLQPNAEKHKQISEIPFDELVAELKNGTLTATEVLQAYQYSALIATETSNCIACFIQNADELAEKLDSLPEDQPKKPLHGVPVSLKETILIKGTESTSGLISNIGKFKDADNSPLVDFLVDQGCIPFCKTNVSQSDWSFDSRNPIYGITIHPTHMSRSPGGSSSGEAALLAQRGSLIGIGYDQGGNARIPSAYCGCCTLKPTSQRMLCNQGGAEVGSEGTVRVMPHDFAVYSFMSKDSAILTAINKLFYSCSNFANHTELVPLALREDLLNSSTPLRIGFYYSLPNTVESVPSIKRAVRLAKEVLEKNGHTLVEFYLPNPRQAYLLYLNALVADGNVDTESALKSDVEISYPNTLYIAIAAWSSWYKRVYAWWNRRTIGSFPMETLMATTPVKRPHDLNILLRKITEYRKQAMKCMQQAKLDALIGPCFPMPAIGLNQPREVTGATVYTALYNMLNWPAGVMPVAQLTQADQNAMASYPELDSYHRLIKDNLSTDSVGLPLAVQIAALPFSEEIVLRIMHELETKLCTN